MKIKVLCLALFLLLFLPLFVHAEECDLNSIKVKSIELNKLSDDVEELSVSSINDNKVNINLKMYDVGDFADYKLKLVNTSNENYYFDEKSFVNSSDYIEYSILDDSSGLIKSKSEKEIFLRVKYKNKIEDDKFNSGRYQDSSNILLNLTNQRKIIDVITNPKTGRVFSFVFIFIILIIITLLYKRVKINPLLILLFLLLPISVYAVCRCKVEVDSNIVISQVKPNLCTFDGELVQGAEYINGQYTYRYMQEGDWNDWKNIENDGWGVVLTDKESTDSVTTPLCTYINDKPVTSMSYMFYDTYAESIDLSSFETTNITNMDHMFSQLQTIKEVDINHFNTENVTNMDHMFSYSRALIKVEANKINTKNVTSMNNMFAYTSALKEIDLSNLNTSSLKKADYMFYGAKSLEKANLSNFIHKNIQSFTYMFGMDVGMKTLIIDNWEPPADVSVGRYSLQFYSDGRANVENIYMRNWKIPEKFEYVVNTWYLQMDNVENIDVSNWDLSETTSIYQLFKDGYHIKHISGMDTWDTSNITNIGELFKYCYVLDEADLSSFDYSKVINVSYMFELDNQIKTIKMGNFNAENLENATRMFSQAEGVEEIIFDSISTPKLKNTEYMFYGLPKLKSLDLRGMNIQNVTDMDYMFAGNVSLEFIDLSTFKTNNSQYMGGMFSRCTSLTNAYARTQEDAARFNATSYKPDNVNFVVRSS